MLFLSLQIYHRDKDTMRCTLSKADLLTVRQKTYHILSCYDITGYAIAARSKAQALAHYREITKTLEKTSLNDNPFLNDASGFNIMFNPEISQEYKIRLTDDRKKVEIISNGHISVGQIIDGTRNNVPITMFAKNNVPIAFEANDLLNIYFVYRRGFGFCENNDCECLER